MGATGAFTLNLDTLGNTTNHSIQTAELVMAEIASQGDLIGLGIAIAVSLGLIFGAVFLVINFIPALVSKVKKIR